VAHDAQRERHLDAYRASACRLADALPDHPRSAGRVLRAAALQTPLLGDVPDTPQFRSIWWPPV